MRTVLLALLLPLLPGTSAAQQPSTAGGTPEVLRREITALEERIGQANFDCDYKFFADVEATEFIFTDAAGGLITRAQDLAGEPTCRPSKGTYRLDDVRVAGYGDVVVFNALATTSTTDAHGKPMVRKHRFTDVLVRRDGRWQLVAGHSSRLP